MATTSSNPAFLDNMKKTIVEWCRPPDVIRTPDMVKPKSGEEKPTLFFSERDGEQRLGTLLRTFEARIRESVVANLNTARDKKTLILSRLDDAYDAEFEMGPANEAVGDLQAIAGSVAQRQTIEQANEEKRIKYWYYLWTHASFYYYFMKVASRSQKHKAEEILLTWWNDEDDELTPETHTRNVWRCGMSSSYR